MRLPSAEGFWPGVARRQGVSSEFCWPGLAPAGEALFFASPKKSTQKKGDPNAASLRFASGNLRWAVQPGSRANSPAAQTSAIPDPPTSALLGPARTGQSGTGTKTKDQYKNQQGLAMASPCFFMYSVLIFGCLVFLLPAPTPCGCAEERRARRIRAKTCLSRRRVVFDPVWTEHTGCP